MWLVYFISCGTINTITNKITSNTSSNRVTNDTCTNESTNNISTYRITINSSANRVPVTPSPAESPAPTESQVTPAPTVDDGFFFCDDGCRIDSYVKDNWCDCSNCQDEDSWNCRNCDCPTYCGGYEYCDGNNGTASPTTACDGTATDGSNCNFNVSFMGLTHDSCITIEPHRPWCYVTEDINHETQLLWGHCDCKKQLLVLHIIGVVQLHVLI